MGDLNDLNTKRKKELGYPLTPVGDRLHRLKKKRNNKDEIEHVNTYDDDLNLENTLSSPTKGLKLQQELKMLSLDDSKWDKRRRTSKKTPARIIYTWVPLVAKLLDSVVMVVIIIILIQ